MSKLRKRLGLWLLGLFSRLLRRMGHTWTASERRLYAEALRLLSNG